MNSNPRRSAVMATVRSSGRPASCSHWGRSPDSATIGELIPHLIVASDPFRSFAGCHCRIRAVHHGSARSGTLPIPTPRRLPSRRPRHGAHARGTGPVSAAQDAPRPRNRRVHADQAAPSDEARDEGTGAHQRSGSFCSPGSGSAVGMSRTSASMRMNAASSLSSGGRPMPSPWHNPPYHWRSTSGSSE